MFAVGFFKGQSVKTVLHRALREAILYFYEIYRTYDTNIDNLEGLGVGWGSLTIGYWCIPGYLQLSPKYGELRVVIEAAGVPPTRVY